MSVSEDEQESHRGQEESRAFWHKTKTLLRCSNHRAILLGVNPPGLLHPSVIRVHECGWMWLQSRPRVTDGGGQRCAKAQEPGRGGRRITALSSAHPQPPDLGQEAHVLLSRPGRPQRTSGSGTCTRAEASRKGRGCGLVPYVGKASSLGETLGALPSLGEPLPSLESEALGCMSSPCFSHRGRRGQGGSSGRPGSSWGPKMNVPFWRCGQCLGLASSPPQALGKEQPVGGQEREWAEPHLPQATPLR